MDRLDRLSRTLATSNQLFQLGLAAVAIMVLGALGFLATEKAASVGDSLWWSFVTMTTIGYGDIVPETSGGRLVGTLVGLSGVVVLSIITAILASILVERRIMEDRGLQRIKAWEHRVLCGWNSHAENGLLGLARHVPNSTVVLVNDLSPDDFADIKYQFRDSLDLRFVKGDYTHESILDKAAAEHAASCMILVDTSGEHQILRSDERAIKGTLTLKALNPKVRVCVELLDRHSEPHLVRARADEIIVRGEYTGLFLSGAACSPGISKVVDELVGPRSPVSIERVAIPASFSKSQYGELARHLCESEGVTALGLQKEMQELKVEDILSDDLSVVEKFIRRKFLESGASLEERLNDCAPLLNPPAKESLEGYHFVLVLKGTS